MTSVPLPGEQFDGLSGLARPPLAEPFDGPAEPPHGPLEPAASAQHAA